MKCGFAAAMCALLAWVASTGFAGAQTAVSIHDIMTTAGTYPLPNSPYLYSHYGASVSVTGVVVGVMNTGGFYISEPSSNWDSLVATAEGMPVFATAGNNPACAVVGNSVTVVGQVVNSAATTAANTPGTGIQPASCTVVSTGNTMTQAISISAVLNSFGGALEYTGMAASNSTFYAVSPTGGTLNEATETATSNGQFWATLSSNTATNNHLFRSVGVAPDEYSGTGATTWTGHPERIVIDTATFGGTPVNITVGQGITCTVPSNITVGATKGIGLIDYTMGYARLLIFPTSVCSVSGTVAATTSAAADATHFHVGTLDLNRFYSTTGATTGSVAVSAEAYTRRITKAANAIVNSLGVPDILSLQEVQDLPTLTDLATAVNTAGGVTYSPYLKQGNDPNSLNLGFLVNSSTITVDTVTQADASATYTTASGGSATLWERPPLVLTAEVHRVGKSYPVTVVNVHLTPRDNIGDATLGPDIRLHRAAQAYDLSQLVQSYQTAGQNVVVDGNFNALEFSDGFVDVLGVVKGSPAASGTVLNYQATATTSALTDFTTSVSQYQRYNYIERGDAVSFEHILASATVTAANTAATSLASYETSVVQPHFSTDFAAVDLNSSTTAAGLTPHDGQVVAFLIPAVPTTATISATALDFGSVYLGASVSKIVTITNTSGFTSTVTINSLAISGTNASDYTQSSSCTTLADGASCTVTLTFAPTATGTRTGLLTVSTGSTSDPTLTTSLTGVGLDTTATLTPTSASFGSVYAGGTSAAKVFTVTNTSGVSIGITGVTVSSSFTETTTCGSTLAANTSCTVSVIFVPTTTGVTTGTLTVTNTSTANPTLTATLSGTGLPTTATLTPSSASYGNVIVSSTSAVQTFTWTNTSSIALAVNSVTATGDFAVASNTCSKSVAAGTSCAIGVTFTPTVLGARTGTLTVTSAASANPTLTAALMGEGVADVEASSSLLSFGNVDIGASSTAQVLTITNYTSASIALTSLTITGDYSETTTCGSTIAGLSTCTITVVFKPTATGVRTGAITLNTNDTKYPVIAVALTGNGVDFSVSLLPTSGSVIAGFGTSTVATLTPIGGFSAAVTVACTTNATGSTCTPATTSLTLAAVTTDATAITTTSQYTVIGYSGLGVGRGRLPALLAALSLLTVCGVWRARRRLPRALHTVLLLFLLLPLGLGLSGCSGKTPDENIPYTSPGTFTYTVTVTDGFLTRTAAYTLGVSVK